MLAFAEACAADVQQVIRMLGPSAASSQMFNARANDGGASVEPAAGPVGMLHKDVSLIREMADAVGAQMPLLDRTRQMLDVLVADGRHEHDTAALITVYEDNAASRSESK